MIVPLCVPAGNEAGVPDMPREGHAAGGGRGGGTGPRSPHPRPRHYPLHRQREAQAVVIAPPPRPALSPRPARCTLLTYVSLTCQWLDRRATSFIEVTQM